MIPALLLFVTAVAGLLVLVGCPNETAVDGSGEESFSFPREMITITAAGNSFTMGNGTYGPDVSQTISYNFKISKTEINNAQFQQFMGDGGYSTDIYWTANGLTERDAGGWTQPSY